MVAMNIGERMKAERLAAGLTQDELAQEAGVTKQAIYAIESGETKNPRFTTLAPIARRLKLSAEWLSSGRGVKTLDDLSGQAPKVLADKVFVSRISGLRISAGTGEVVYDFEEIDESHAFKRDWMSTEGLDPKSCKLIDVSGDSMSPTLEDGETILVNIRDREPKHNKIFALISDDGIRVKRLLRRNDGQWEIHSDNPMKHLYPTERFSPGDIAIWGRVRWHAGTL